MTKKIIIVLLVIFILNILYGRLSVSGTSVGEVLHGPKIEVSPESWDFGTISETEIKTHIFKVKNIGDKELIIDSIGTSCGCTTAEISAKQIGPGNSTELKVTFDPRQTKASGKLKRDIYIESNDPNQPSKIVSIVVELKLKREAKPKGVNRRYRISSSKIKRISVPKISSNELYSRIQSGENLVILDVREENEYVGRHIPQAIWFPKSKFDRSAPDILKKLEKIDKETPLVTYCGAGHRSNYVAKKLIEMGYNAFNLDGISFWVQEGYPVVEGPKLAPTQEPAIIHLEEAYENYYILFKDVVWVDVRNTEDYRRAHIKGALSIPLSEIESRLEEIPTDKEIVLYCEGTWDGGSCEASRSAGRILIKNGFSQGKIKVFEDGFGAWENAGYPIESSPENIIPENIYSEFICECCGKTIVQCKCPMASKKRAYLDGLIDGGLSENEILLRGARRFGLQTLANEDIRTQIRLELLRQAPGEHPEIAIEPLKYDFGKLSISKGKVETSFIIRNKGNADLIIDNIKTSCGCTVASLKTADGKKTPEFSIKGKSEPNWQISILPGAEVELVVSFDPNYHPPKKFPTYVTRTITISSNDPIESKKIIKIRAHLVQ
jgi:rhodanese-related sulfurtransferase